ncbi:primase-like DNA-binding domain-containing protein [Lonepinella sp. MS14436]|uniref:DNA primase family protein n=1 Tax=Lonepinella sp. MS14436 TaxID=3003619 RepID=UPI0036DA30C2
MTKFTNAPHLKEPWNNQLFSDLIILAGSDAWGTWGKGKGTMWRILVDGLKMDYFIDNGGKVHPYDQKPVILDVKQLTNLDRTRICNPDQRAIKIFQCGELTQEQKTAICLNLATNNKVNGLAVGLYNGVTMEKEENLSGYIERLRTQESEQDLAKMIAISVAGGSNDEINLDSNSTTEKQKTDAFFKWRNQPLGRDLTLSKSFIYNGKAWLDYSDEELKRDIVKFYNEHNASYRNSTINNLAEIIILNMATVPQANGRFIAFENGVIDKFTGDFLEHNQQQGVRGLEPYSVTLSEDTPHFDSWLKFVANGDEEKEQAIMAGLYMILTNRHKWQLFLELVGTAGAGKSILSGIAETVNGKGNTASMKIEQLIDPINIATLIDKSLLLSPEQGEYSKGAEDLKRITGGDLTRAKIHYQMPIDIVLQLVVVLITNTPLYFPDLNGGIARRRVIIHFDRKVPEDKKDVNFLDKVKLEVYGIIKLLLKAFPEPETARTILETYRENHKGLATKIQADHLIDFAQEFYIKPVEPTDPPNERNDKINGLYWGSNKGIKDFHTALYRAYIHFCECTNQRKVMSLSIFKQRLPDALKETGQKGEVVERLKDNTLVTNIYYKDKMLTLAKWQG